MISRQLAWLLLSYRTQGRSKMEAKERRSIICVPVHLIADEEKPLVLTRLSSLMIYYLQRKGWPLISHSLRGKIQHHGSCLLRFE